MKMETLKLAMSAWQSIRKSRTLHEVRSQFLREVYLLPELVFPRKGFRTIEHYRTWRDIQIAPSLDQFDVLVKRSSELLQKTYWYLDIFLDAEFCESILVLKHRAKTLPREPKRTIAYLSSPVGVQALDPSTIVIAVSPFSAPTEVRQFLSKASKAIQTRQNILSSHYKLDKLAPPKRESQNKKRDELIRTLWDCHYTELQIVTGDMAERRKDILISHAMEIVDQRVSTDLVRKIAGTKHKH